MRSNNSDFEDISSDRSAKIVRASIVGIISNFFLVVFKAGVGFISGSIAIILDAVNNLSDALSSIVTIIGTKLAGRKPDKKHPLGHGRIEYLSAMIVAALVIYAGVTSLVESVKKIISPVTADYSAVTLIIISSAIVVKLLLGRYVISVGRKVNSSSLVASGKDALFDAVISVSVLASALVFLLFRLSVEAYVGVGISVYIIKSGFSMLSDTLGDILGKRVDGQFLDEIKATIGEIDGVLGAFDLILHSYGPDKYLGSVHVEVPETLTAPEIDALERRIANRVYEKHGVIMTGVGIYSINTSDEEAMAMRAAIDKLALSHDGVLQTHGFFIDKENKTATLDVIIDFSVEDRKSLFDHISKDISEQFPDYKFILNMDIDF
ncbi:MAG: cation transporter [Oscillospiraceae bacterium]|nr:cation transporter [Oscillospiraceae bacterium]MBQ3986101.1 cation transporter [Oscillospiraceae bacterium]MBQ5514789.1 cation transporter [Oscillospiraceae bacterium]